jgi:hypothetical protein
MNSVKMPLTFHDLPSFRESCLQEFVSCRGGVGSPKFHKNHSLHTPLLSRMAFGDVATVFVHATNLLWAKDALYVADTFNNAIRKIDPAIGATVSTLAGGTGRGFQDCPGSSARFLWPRGLAVHEGTLYVTEEGNSSAVHGGSQQFTHQLKYQLSTVTAPHAGPFQVSPPIIVP